MAAGVLQLEVAAQGAFAGAALPVERRRWLQVVLVKGGGGGGGGSGGGGGGRERLWLLRAAAVQRRTFRLAVAAPALGAVVAAAAATAAASAAVSKALSFAGQESGAEFVAAAGKCPKRRGAVDAALRGGVVEGIHGSSRRIAERYATLSIHA